MSDTPDSGLRIGGLQHPVSPAEGMRDFERQIMRDQAKARAQSNTHSGPPRGRVESQTSSTPMAPRAFQAPGKREITREDFVFPKHKPFAFALEYDSSGAMCYFGNLIVGFTYASASFAYDEGGGVLTSSQQEIAEPTVYPAVNLNIIDNWSRLPTRLGFFGDVWLKWECDETGVIDASSVEVVGPDAPTLVPIPAYESETPPTPTTCRYAKNIGSVAEDGTIVQILSADFHWYFHLFRASSTAVPPPP